MIALSLVLGVNGWAQAEPAPPESPEDLWLQAPNPALDPAQVVRIQLNALRQGDDEGLAVVYRFASPGNRKQTGPLARFSAMLRNSYPQLIGHESVELAPTLIDGARAIQAVEVLGQDEQTHRYVFLLRRQKQVPFENCWMTDSVVVPEREALPVPDV